MQSILVAALFLGGEKLSIQIYILSKLMEGDSYPYQLKKGLSEPVAFDKMANISESKLYYHFESLSKQGLIAPIEMKLLKKTIVRISIFIRLQIKGVQYYRRKFTRSLKKQQKCQRLL